MFREKLRKGELDGKVIELELGAGVSKADAEKRVKEMCEKLLANTVIESYRIDLVA